MLAQQSDYKPKALFSISQVEKAFGHGYEQLTVDASDGTDRVFDLHGLDPVEHGSESGCIRSWGFRYLVGLKEPELTWEQACALPENTDTEKRYKAGAKARTWGKVAELELERWLKRDPTLATRPLDPHVNAGLYLLPAPTDLLEYELQAPVSVKTTPEAISWAKTAIPSDMPGATPVVSWQGFKDFRGRTFTRVPGATEVYDSRRFLIDFKTTKPKVDNRYNTDHGREAGTWRYRKVPEQLRLDWQYNLYQWDEYLRYGALSVARWVYFASPGSDKYPNKPEACASDMPDTSEAALAIVREVVRALDARGRVLLGHVRAVQAGAPALDYTQALPGNILACGAFGGCPFSRRLGGPCTIEQTGVIPVARLAATAKTKTASSGLQAFSVQPFTDQNTGDRMNVFDQIQAQMKADQAAKAQGPAGAPPPPAAPAAWTPPTAAPGPMSPGFTFPAPAAPPPGPPQFGQAAAPGWLHDGQGGYFPEAQLTAMAQAGHAGAQALVMSRQPVPAVAPSPTPGLPPEAFAPGGPMGPAVVEPAPTGAPPPPPIGAQAEAPKKGRGRLKGSTNATPTETGAVAPGQDTRDTDPAPALMAWDRIADALERICAKIGA